MNLHLTDHQGAATEKTDPLGEPWATMYSSGNPEDGSESNKNKNEFLEKLRQARFSVKPSLGSVDSTVFAYELLRLRLRSFRFVLIINVA